MNSKKDLPHYLGQGNVQIRSLDLAGAPKMVNGDTVTIGTITYIAGTDFQVTNSSTPAHESAQLSLSQQADNVAECINSSSASLDSQHSNILPNPHGFAKSVGTTIVVFGRTPAETFTVAADISSVVYPSVDESLPFTGSGAAIGDPTDVPAVLPTTALPETTIALLKAIANKQFTIDGDVGSIEMNTDDLEEIGMGLIIADLKLKTDSATTADVTYVGDAPSGTLTSAAGWRIFAVDNSVAGNTDLSWAVGDQTFTHIWDDRASISYS